MDFRARIVARRVTIAYRTEGEESTDHHASVYWKRYQDAARTTGQDDEGYGRAMRGFIILLWIFWANLAFVFGSTTFYFVRIANWRGLITAPIFAVLLFAGWRLWTRSRRDWNALG